MSASQHAAAAAAAAATAATAATAAANLCDLKPLYNIFSVLIDDGPRLVRIPKTKMRLKQKIGNNLRGEVLTPVAYSSLPRGWSCTAAWELRMGWCRDMKGV